jgi:hypothetical protein
MQVRRAICFAFGLMLPLSFAPDADAAPTATISGSFEESCRRFVAHSSKDVSHVVIHYADGRVVKDEKTTSPDYSIGGPLGAPIASVDVKSGITTATFTCTATNSAPTALLEVRTPADFPDCHLFFESGLICDQMAARTMWRSSGDFPTEPATPGGSTVEAGHLLWGCQDSVSGQCSFTVEFRGTGSSDPDNNLTGWQLDFGDGTSTGGSWTADPPAAVSHTYSAPCVASLYCVVTLTVTDSGGLNDMDPITMGFIDQTPD